MPGLKQLQPEGCKEVKDEVIEKLWFSNDWIAERKYDGGRYLCHVTKAGLRFTSRRRSVKDDKYVEKTDKVPHLAKVKLPLLEGTILDGELVMEEGISSDVFKLNNIGKQKYIVFDILFFSGTDLRRMPYWTRRSYLKLIMKHHAFGEGIKLIKQKMGAIKKRFCDSEMKAGREGIILKNKNSAYGENWIKVKARKTFDVICMGYADATKETAKVSGGVSLSKYYKNGWVGAIKFGMYFKGELVEIGQTSGMNEEVRAEVSLNKKKYIGRVLEIEGQEILKSGSIRHPRFIQWRDDKNPKDCLLERYKEWVDINSFTRKNSYGRTNRNKGNFS